MLLIDKELAKLEDDAECASLPKFTELMKKPFNLTKTGKEKPHCPIFYSLSCFVEPDKWPDFCFIKGLMGLTDGLVMGEVELKGGEVAVGFSR